MRVCFCWLDLVIGLEELQVDALCRVRCKTLTQLVNLSFGPVKHLAVLLVVNRMEQQREKMIEFLL